MGRPVVPANLAEITELSELDTLRRSLSAYSASQLAAGGEAGTAEAQWASLAAMDVEADIDRRNAETQFAAGIMTQVGTAIDEKLDPINTALTAIMTKVGADGAVSVEAGAEAATEGTEGAEGTQVEPGAEAAAGEGAAAGTEGGEGAAVGAAASGDAGAGGGSGAGTGGAELSEPTAEELAANDATGTVPAVVKKNGLGVEGGVLKTARAAGDFAQDRTIDNYSDLAEYVYLACRDMSEGDSKKLLKVELDHSQMTQLSGDEEVDFGRLLGIRDQAMHDEELMASGGWGAHSEVRYDFFGIEDVAGIVELPTVGVNRGGLKWPVSPSIQDALPSGNTGIWLWTEANDITAASNVPIGDSSYGSNLFKPTYKIPTPSMTEKRLDMHGVQLTAGNLMTRAWPEAIRRFIALTMAANTHTINSRRLTALAAAGTAVDLTTALAGVSIESALVGAWALKGATYRAKYRMADDAVLECKIPSWVPRAIALALPRRQFDEDREFTMAKLTALAAAQDVRLQFVQDWEMISATATAFPSTFHMMMWAPGTNVIGSGPSIDLGVTRDSLLNASNDYTAVWTEQALSLMQFGHEALTINMPGVYTGVSKIAA